MKRIFLLVLILLPILLYAQETITISGQVTDYDNKPVANCWIRLIGANWTDLHDTYSDDKGFYSLNNIPSGEYMAMYAIVEDEYPRSNAVPEEDMRLEFWAWNIIADRDLTINPRYHRMELYGTTAYQVFGGYPGFFIYFRPMGVTKSQMAEKEVWLDKTKAEKENRDISIDPEHLEVNVYADDELLKVNSVTRVQEYVGDDKGMGAYLVQVDKPKNRTDKPYIVFRVIAKDTSTNETGENLYFYRKPQFHR